MLKKKYKNKIKYRNEIHGHQYIVKIRTHNSHAYLLFISWSFKYCSTFYLQTNIHP